MREDLRKLAMECGPFAEHHVEVSHLLFDLYLGRDLHADFVCFKGSDYLILVDRLTRYIDCSRTHDQSTAEAILAIRRWSSRFGLPFKVISDGGGCFKLGFINELKNMGITHHPSSVYNPRSNSLAELEV